MVSSFYRETAGYARYIIPLTISQPWASLIASGEKWIENRRWYTEYRGPLAIHAGKGTQYLTRDELAGYPTGCVVAVVDLVACVRNVPTPHQERLLQERGIALDVFMDHEHREGPWCWVLCNVRRLPEPVPCRGAQGLWVTPADVQESVRRQVA